MSDFLSLNCLNSSKCDSIDGSYNNPPYILGCKVFTLPFNISGNPV